MDNLQQMFYKVDCYMLAKSDPDFDHDPDFEELLNVISPLEYTLFELTDRAIVGVFDIYPDQHAYYRFMEVWKENPVLVWVMLSYYVNINNVCVPDKMIDMLNRLDRAIKQKESTTTRLGLAMESFCHPDNLVNNVEILENVQSFLGVIRDCVDEIDVNPSEVSGLLAGINVILADIRNLVHATIPSRVIARHGGELWEKNNES